MLPLGEDDALGRPLDWGQLREMAIAADEGGLDSVWGADYLIVHLWPRTAAAVVELCRAAEIGRGKADAWLESAHG